ncbi:helix-turn-helix domain-containing protein [Pseudoxanthomonas daejeonensis]|uniref:AraC family transcriptional regulator n=1 Tax=Pseudoxanthomonas daejeonensis TaxID=266062 RepID=A0ABQ6Z941_9GAMM|nr:helix-turn-helix domain-containing protein [Pseudoxanthomonas daejeonensis]KAF1695442.1 AraC family transcriptional regulator [Pseudoxanthomonas daejeonensis]
MTARAPLPAALRPYVGNLWVGQSTRARREHVIPSGEMHLAVRIDGPALRLYASRDDEEGEAVAAAVVCGARSRYYAKRAEPCCTVGAQLLPGASQALFGVPATAIAERHAPLREFWGDAVDALQRELAATTTPEARLHALESTLLAQLRPVEPLPSHVTRAIAGLDEGEDLHVLLAGAGCSHRHFIARFRDATGLAPKRYARLRRFQRVLAQLDLEGTDWGTLALDHGYCDQAHLARDFREFAGLPARAYERARLHPRHVLTG